MPHVSHSPILISIFFILYIPTSTSLGLVKEIYCGLDSCYDVLGVTRSTPKSELRSHYRSLSKTKHPDKFISARNSGELSEEKYAIIEEEYRVINVAYDTLKKEDSKKDYNHYLDHPEDRYYNYYRYYSNKYHQDIDVRLVVLGCLVAWSMFQWVGWSNSYQSVVTYALQDNKYRMQAKKLAIERGLLDLDGKLPKKQRRTLGRPDDIKKEMDNIFKGIIEENVDVRGGFGKPKITDVVLVQTVYLPWIIYTWCKGKLVWYYRREILKVDYSDEEKWIMIKRHFECKSNVEFEYLRDKRGDEIWNAECWDKDNAKKFQDKIAEEQRLKNAESGRAKQMRRYMKTHGKARMTFNENDDGEWED